MNEGTPVMACTGVTYLVDGRPIEYFIELHRGDRGRFEPELFRPSEAIDLAAVRYRETARILHERGARDVGARDTVA